MSTCPSTICEKHHLGFIVLPLLLYQAAVFIWSLCILSILFPPSICFFLCTCHQRRQWHPTPELLPAKSHGWRSWGAAVHGVAKSRTRLRDFTFTFRFHALEKEMATYFSVLAWRIPGTGEAGGLLSMGSHRVGHDWSNLAAAVAYATVSITVTFIESLVVKWYLFPNLVLFLQHCV